MRSWCLTSVVLLAVLMPLPAAFGDVLTLKGGIVFEGRVSEGEDDYTVEMPHATVKFAKSEVSSVTYGPTPLEEFQSRSRKLSSDDAQEWYALGLYAKSKGLLDHSTKAFEKAVLADSAHKGAREQLGFVFDDGEWITRDEAAERRGYVRYGGGYVTREEADAIAAADTGRARVAQWRTAIRTHVFVMQHATASKGVEAREKLAGTSDPAALDPLIEELENPDGAIRSTVLLALLNYREDKAALAALEVAMWDEDRDVSYQARVVLNRKQNETAFKQALQLLRWDDDETRFRISQVLGAIGDPRAVPYLIEYLYWSRPRMDEPPPGRPRTRRRRGTYSDVTPSFVYGFEAKLAPDTVAYIPILAGYRRGKIIILRDEPPEDQWRGFPASYDERVLNYDALNALKAMTGADFRFDREAWRRWYLAALAREKRFPKAVGPQKAPIE